MKNILIAVLLLVASTGLYASDADGSGTAPSNTDDDGNKGLSCFLAEQKSEYANEEYRYETAAGTVVCVNIDD